MGPSGGMAALVAELEARDTLQQDLIDKLSGSPASSSSPVDPGRCAAAPCSPTASIRSPASAAW
jgi:hypothetical protein